jgi:hypothetical protein
MKGLRMKSSVLERVGALAGAFPGSGPFTLGLGIDLGSRPDHSYRPEHILEKVFAKLHELEFRHW